MDIKYVTNAEMVSATATNSGLFNVAVNCIIPALGNPAGTKAAPVFTVYVYSSDGEAEGTIVGGTSEPVRNVHPAYYPVATKGAECAAVVTNLSWADNNLAQGYEWFAFNTTSGTTKYFVSGILNSSQTQANDPFDSSDAPGIVNGCCWAGDYTVGLNPFA